MTVDLHRAEVNTLSLSTIKKRISNIHAINGLQVEVVNNGNTLIKMIYESFALHNHHDTHMQTGVKTGNYKNLEPT